MKTILLNFSAGVLNGSAATTASKPGLQKPGEFYYVIHGVAVGSLLLSISVSLATLTYLLRHGSRNIFQRKIRERLVIYLAICDLLYSSDHMVDHIYMLATANYPPDVMCAITGFFLQEFATAQSIIVAFTAVNGWLLVVKERRFLELGAYDWRLHVTSLGIPAVFGIICASLGLLGPSEAWCMADMRKEGGKIVNNLVAVLMIAVFLVDLLSYISIWCKINNTQKLLRDFLSSSEKKRQRDKKKSETVSQPHHHRNRGAFRSAKIMSCFVFAYIMQWWPFILYSIWSFVTTPHVSLLILNVIFCNMGGVFNCLAYTVIRVKYSANSPNKANQRAIQNASHQNGRQAAVRKRKSIDGTTPFKPTPLRVESSAESTPERVISVNAVEVEVERRISSEC